jgi:magnesium transporter
MVMRTLTIITIVLAVPTIVFSFYGMNVEGLPFMQSFIFPVLLALVVSVAVALIIVKAKLFR